MQQNVTEKEFYLLRNIREQPIIRKALDVIRNNSHLKVTELIALRGKYTVEDFRFALHWVVEEGLAVRSVDSDFGTTTHKVHLLMTDFGKKIISLLPPLKEESEAVATPDAKTLHKLLTKNPRYADVLRTINKYPEGRKFHDLEVIYRPVSTVLQKLMEEGAITREGHSAPYVITETGKSVLETLPQVSRNRYL